MVDHSTMVTRKKYTMLFTPPQDKKPVRKKASGWKMAHSFNNIDGTHSWLLTLWRMQ